MTTLINVDLAGALSGCIASFKSIIFSSIVDQYCRYQRLILLPRPKRGCHRWRRTILLLAQAIFEVCSARELGTSLVLEYDAKEVMGVEERLGGILGWFPRGFCHRSRRGDPWEYRNAL